MTKRMLIDAQHAEETRVVIADESQIFDFDFISAAKKQLKGNIYLAKITRVEPSLQAAFVEYGGGKQGFLPFAEIHPDYYQIPSSDRRRLMEEAENESAESDEPVEQAGDIAADGSHEPHIHSPDEAAGEAVAYPGLHGSHDGQALDPQAALPELPELAVLDPIPEEGEEADEARGAGESAHVMSELAEFPQISQDMPPPEGEQQDALSAQETAEQNGEYASAASGENGGHEPARRGEEVETLASEEEEFRSKPKKNFFRRYKIQEVIKRGQIVLVQVIKEERGNKGVSLTSYLSLAGRYCVLMPNSPKDGGISRKIATADDRKRLKSILTELKLARGMSIIIRTAGMGRTRAEIKRDFDYLVKLWNQIRENTLSSVAPALVYEESNLIKRAIRDQYTNDIEEVLVEGDAAYRSAKEFMKLLLPSHTPKIKHYKDPTPLFYAHNIEDQLLSMHDPVVKLRSGGYIVLSPTEALVSIDVNSGRSTSERNIEETALRTNMEAAVEVARQLRLRDLAGLIVIDFIDMLEARNRRAVERALKDALKVDRAKIQLGRISPFGLLEMSRQRMRPSISETNTVQCPHCVGRGVIRSNESMSIQLIRALEKEASTGNWSGLRLVAPEAVALHLLNHKRHLLGTLEQRHNVQILVLAGHHLTASDFTLEKMRKSQSDRVSGDNRRPRRGEPRHHRGGQHEAGGPYVPQGGDAAVEPVEPPEMEEVQEASPDGVQIPSNRRGGRRRGRRGGRGRQDYGGATRESFAPQQDEADSLPGSDLTVAESYPQDDSEVSQEARPRSARGERGGRGRSRRRWRERGENRPDGESSNGAVPQDSSEPQAHDPSSQGHYRQPAQELLFPAVDPAPRPAAEPRRQLQAAASAAPAPESTPRDPNAPPRKGWWRRMIELDEQ